MITNSPFLILQFSYKRILLATSINTIKYSFFHLLQNLQIIYDDPFLFLLIALEYQQPLNANPLELPLHLCDTKAVKALLDKTLFRNHQIHMSMALR